MDLAVEAAAVRVDDDRRGSRWVVESEDVEFLLIVGSSRGEGRPERVRVLEASALALEHPTADQEELQRRQLDTAEGGHLAEPEGVADWACR